MTRHLWERISPEERAVIDNFTGEFPVKVGALAKALGLNVIKSPLPPKISGLIQPSEDAPAQYVIKVNKYEPTERQRYTIAHEIAHYLLHRDRIGAGVIDSIMYRSNLTSRREVEANQLAADIIMPKSLVSRQYRALAEQDDPDLVEELASAFRVSVPAMEVRLGVV
jgi:Zn-dependent peptidase ImmA (M78 family)